MKRKVHTESEMVKVVQELESCMEVCQVRRLKELEEENSKLKQKYAEKKDDILSQLECAMEKVTKLENKDQEDINNE